MLQSMGSQRVRHDCATELNENGLEGVNLIQMTMISTTVGKNPVR